MEGRRLGWQLCDDAYFRGSCVTLGPGEYPSLRAMGMNDRVSPVRDLVRPPGVQQLSVPRQPGLGLLTAIAAARLPGYATPQKARSDEPAAAAHAFGFALAFSPARLDASGASSTRSASVPATACGSTGERTYSRVLPAKGDQAIRVHLGRAAAPRRHAPADSTDPT